ncbi:MAG: ABC transporter permease [Rhizobacter sp.]
MLTRLRLVYSVAKAQLQTSLNNFYEDFYQLIAIPLVGIAPLAIFVHAGRDDLVAYAFVAIVTMTIGQMGLFTGSETIAADKRFQLVELIVSSPTPYFVIIVIRALVFATLGTLSILIAWFFIQIWFATPLIVHHPALLCASVFLTVIATAGLSTVTTALFSLAKSVRTLQASIYGPLYLLGGVLVPVSFLPVWVQWLSPLVFFYWSASLIRDALNPAIPSDVAIRLVWIGMSAVVFFVLGGFLLARMLNVLRREGTLGLVE